MTDHVSTSAVAKTLKITPRQVARLVQSGALVPVVRAPGIRGAFLFDPADVAAYAATRAGASA